MKKILFFKISSTGPILWKERSAHPAQPHMLRLSAIMLSEQGHFLDLLDAAVRPKGWDVDGELSESILNAVGVDELTVLSAFYDMYQECDFRVAHDTTFNNRMLRITGQRYLKEGLFGDEFKDKTKYFCTLRESKKIFGKEVDHDLASIYSRYHGDKNPFKDKLFADVRTMAEIYFAMNK